MLTFTVSAGMFKPRLNSTCWVGPIDRDVLRAAYLAGRAVLTHDSDFGGLAVVAAEPCIGIVYLRPGQIRAEFTIGTLDTLIRRDPDVQPPFILVARRTQDEVVIRVRRL